MPSGTQFSSTDREDLERRGIPLEEARRQLRLLEKPPPPVVLERACRVGDGIAVLEPSRWSDLERAWEVAVRKLRVVKFVPAAGAATRMFSFLSEAAESLGDSGRAALEQAADLGDSAASQALELADGIRVLPFAPALATLAAERRIDLADLHHRPLALGALIAGSEGLDLAALPKGLVPFHTYPSEIRSSFEEHLYEAVGYARSRDHVVALHFTVASEHLPLFEKAARRAAKAAGQSTGIDFEIEFSAQDPATDTLAITLAVSDDGSPEPLRSRAGRMVFRPAGHGALIANLGRLDADVAFIKNIDNIARAEHHRETAAWKRRLGAHLLDLRKRSFELLDRLERSHPLAEVRAATRATDDALSFCRENLALTLPAAIEGLGPETLRSFLVERLDRPLRVCGVVENVGEPGGGPFWVAEGDEASEPGVGRGKQLGQSGQIVESSQIDLESGDQADIFRSASHFNPVDVVCALRDRNGRPYDLSRFTDPSLCFVARKKHRGRSIRALERPGLWNGAMAYWNTAFVEVPLGTFTPVKTILDLLRPEHQA